MANDPQFVFFKECYKKFIPIISIFEKINNRCLHLDGYFLTINHCRAFEQACIQFPDALTSLLLKNNGLEDKSTAMIVNGLSYLTSIKKLVIVNNEFGKQSFEALVKILTRPKILFDELRLSNCRMLP